MMELDNLKSAWSKFASAEEHNRVFSEKEVSSMLATQTRNITHKIGCNIRIGVGIVIAWVVLGILMNVFVSPLFDKILDKPYMTDGLVFWSNMIEIFTYVLILSAILIFWVRYSKVEKSNIDASNLKQSLTRLIAIVESYKKMFYVVLGIILFYITVSFSSGFFLETKYQAKASGINLNELNFQGWLLMGFVFVFTLGIFLATYYWLFNFFFKRLYGRYLAKMKATLKELDEAS